MIGRYIAELQVPTDGSVRFELDNGPHGHSTIWAGLDTVRDMIVSVVPY
jgi:hypothetical protein